MQIELSEKSLQGMSLQEAVSLKQQVVFDLIQIKNQLDAAKAEYLATGKKADPVWFSRAKTAARFHGQKDQQLAAYIKDLKEKEKVVTQQTFASRFVDAAREMLPEDVFDRIKREAIGL